MMSIKYMTEKVGKRPAVIYIPCPKCGRIGRLAVKRRDWYGKPSAFWIIHNRICTSKYCCSVGSTDESFDELYKIWKEVREKEGRA